MPGISVNASRYGTPGEIIAVKRGQVVWVGLIKDVDKSGIFDALFCHDDDEERVIGQFAGLRSDEAQIMSPSALKVTSNGSRLEGPETQGISFLIP